VGIAEQGVAYPHIHIGQNGFAPSGLHAAFVLMHNKAVAMFGRNGLLSPYRRAQNRQNQNEKNN